jgi:hypothetical protein
VAGGRLPRPFNVGILNGSWYFRSMVSATGFLATFGFFVSWLPPLSPFGHRAFLFWVDPKPEPVSLNRTARLSLARLPFAFVELANRREARWHH